MAYDFIFLQPSKPNHVSLFKRGVSAQKEEVHAAVKNLDQGIFPKAFCKIYPDYLGGMIIL